MGYSVQYTDNEFKKSLKYNPRSPNIY